MRMTRVSWAVLAAGSLLAAPLSAQTVNAEAPNAEEGESLLERMARIKLLAAQNELAVFKAELDSLETIEFDDSVPIGAVTKNQIRINSPEQTHGRLQDVFWDMIEVEDRRRDRIATQPLRGLPLKTKPVTAALPNLCRQDVLDVEFSATGAAPDGADTHSRAVGVTAQSWWAVTAPPQNGWLNEVSDGVADCPDFPTDGTEFSAESDMVAAEGYLAWTKLREQALDKGVDYQCQFYPADDSRTCAEQIAVLPLKSLTSVRRCAEWDGGRCYRLHVAAPSAIHDIFVEFHEPIFDLAVSLHEVSLLSLTVVDLEEVD